MIDDIKFKNKFIGIIVVVQFFVENKTHVDEKYTIACSAIN